MDSVYLMGRISAFVGRSQGIMDAANAFLHVNNDEDVLMLLRGNLAELMVKVDPSMYREYVTTSKKGVLMLYVKLDKAMYGMLRAALLFYKKLRKDLEKMGFVINPYNPCVANKMVNGKQMTVCWHVDDFLVTHMEEDAITGFSLALANIYGPKRP